MAQESTLSPLSAAAEPERRRGRGPWAIVLQSLLRRKLAMLSIIYILLFYICGLGASIFAPYSPRAQNLDQALQSPSREHLLGTDRLGRDLLSRVMYAARTTSIITIITAISGGLILGPALGLLAGYRRGWIDSLINRVGEVVISVPDLMILIMLTATFGQRLNTWIAGYYDLPLIGSLLRDGFASILVLNIILTALGWVGAMRGIRALTLQLRETDYVLAARSVGAGTWRVILSHILPNLSHFLILGVFASFGAIALAEIGLSFLGLGVRPPAASFGEMILNGASVRTLQASPHLFFAPAFFAVALFLSFNLFADALNDVLNPRTRLN